ncbi:DUF2066 domain-containing protein [Grimontia sp. NTOU-MAR1]|uniref:DUF2066 domain-containing protein n=1 Tax=Grimontia sp. NTOU-MAR1 TaxID=3111011 RepID=UPI002DB91250|nr:DUF2066 domain-containing protein [Grimontia sp. NTOU-MAR1]WRV97368.1 DUF2066 domain-containing protein [Grimontia sp. NTOU-MAR1]
MLRIFIFVLALVLGQTSAMATSLFSAEVVLDDSDAATEQAAKKAAFVDVLIRASGQSEVGNNPVIQKTLPTVNQYITQLGYGDVDGQRSLVLGFDDRKIRTLLTQAQATYWGTPRPEILFWLVEDNASQRNVVWEQSVSPLINELKAEGERRGLPVLMPVGDFDDVVAVSIPDLWGGFAGPIAQASARYNPAGVAVVKVRNNGISWQLFPNAVNIGKDAPVEGRASGTPEQAFATMIDEMADFYSARLAVNLGVADSDAKVLEVSGLDDAEDFFVIERTLKGLNSVASLRLESIIEGTATFRVSLLASEDIFHNEMMVDRRLRRVEALPEPVIEETKSPLVTESVDGVIVPVEPTPVAEPVEAAIQYEWIG